MGPSKKSKLDDQNPTPSEDKFAKDETTTAEGASNNQGAESIPADPSGSATPKSTSSTRGSSKSWYGGSWRAKASPVVALAENTDDSKDSRQQLFRDEQTKGSSGPNPAFLTKRRSSKGNPIAASMTKVNATTNGGDEGPSDAPKNEPLQPEAAPAEPPLPPEPTSTSPETEQTSTLEKAEEAMPAATTNRFSGIYMLKSWWSRPDGYDGSIAKSGEEKAEAESTTETPQEIPLPGKTPVEEASSEAKALTPDGANDQQKSVKSESSMQATEKPSDAKPAVGTSWFWLWSRSQDTLRDQAKVSANQEQPKAPELENIPKAATQGAEMGARKSDDMAVKTNGNTQKTESVEPAIVKKQVAEPQIPPEQPRAALSTPRSAPKASGWAFWSRENPSSTNEADSVHKEVGELAVADTPSQSKPEAAQFNEREETKNDDAKNTKAKIKPSGARKDALKKAVTAAASTVDRKTLSQTPRNSTTTSAQETAPSKQPPGILTPGFTSTYQFAQSPTVWQRIRQYLVGSEEVSPHLHIVPSPPRIKKALAIGVHGYFPSPLIRTVIGQPTGTSIKFANYAASAIAEWTHSHGGYTCEIEKVALEGEGYIADRVNTLWKLLLNWIEHVRSADFIMIACHSQGVPVAIMLVAKLIAFGCINQNAKIGICAMAGINLGPFVEYKTRYLGNTAAELFEFSNPKSVQSTVYLNALREVLKFGAKLVYVGSIDDQLVSLESSTFANISHPYIYRAVFVDGRLHTPDFITHLVGFTLKLRNLGLPDHGLIHELSPALAGSLYTGEGHSRLYEDPNVYALTIAHALQTTNLAQEVPLAVKDFQGSSSSINPNPYFLPWAMRGLLEEEFVRRELGKEVDELLNMFEAWKPTTKALKDVRFRLEAVRSKL